MYNNLKKIELSIMHTHFCNLNLKIKNKYCEQNVPMVTFISISIYLAYLHTYLVTQDKLPTNNSCNMIRYINTLDLISSFFPPN